MFTFEALAQPYQTLGRVALLAIAVLLVVAFVRAPTILSGMGAWGRRFCCPRRRC